MRHPQVHDHQKVFVCSKMFEYFCLSTRNLQLLMRPIPRLSCSWWTETHSGKELAQHTLLSAWKSIHYNLCLNLVSSAKTAASRCIAAGGKYCTQSLLIGRETKLQQQSLSPELLSTDTACPSFWESHMNNYPLRRQPLLNMAFLDLVKMNLAFSHLFGCHFSHDIAMMGGEVPTFFLGKHK